MQPMNDASPSQGIRHSDFDVVVVGAGFGGLYAIHRFRELGFSVLGLEGAGGVGGVWYHNRYPGARVDVDSIDYCYYFSPELYREWRWSERYASQPELLRYLNHVADRFALRQHILFNNWVIGAQWRSEACRYHLKTSTGRPFTCRFLVMTTGQLSAPRKPDFRGLDRFKGEWVQTSRWPDRHIEFANRRIGIIGTGSTGVQAVPVLAEEARHLYVFQRSPNYSVPAQNGPLDEALWQEIRSRVSEERKDLFGHPAASHIRRARGPAQDFRESERAAMLEEQWALGGHGMGFVFGDQTVSKETNDIVAEFVRSKIRGIVKDPATAEKLCPYDHPIGTRRLCIDTSYYESYNRDNVTLVDVREHPIECITETGIKTANAHYELDLIVFALGFHAFTGSLDAANIRNEAGQQPSDMWKRGPRTLLGLMTVGFPNLFLVTGPGSPSVLANMSVQNEYHVDWIGDCIAYMARNGFATIEPTEEAQDAWTAHVAEVSSKILRRNVKNYMVHVNEDDGTRIFMPYVGGMDQYVRQADEIAAKEYEGFRLSRAVSKAPHRMSDPPYPL
jgi:cation diffusion facilitator CzcD-associated flavoprotein CzcO